MSTQGTPRPAPRSLSQTVDVETPELVVLSYTIAGVGSRAYAAILDYLICLIVIFVAWVLVVAALPAATDVDSRTPDEIAGWAFALFALAQFAVLWGYYVLFEALADGQTPGKRRMKLRVVRDGGLSVTFGASAIRNLVRIVDMQPGFFYAAGIVSAMVTKSGKRLGDLAAGTMVVKEDVIPAPMTAVRTKPGAPLGAPVAALHAALSDAEFEVLDRFAQRRAQLPPEIRARLAAQLEERFAAQLAPFEGRGALARLVQLHESERVARAQGAAARDETGAARERHAIVASNAAKWADFATTLSMAQQGGLRAVGENGVRDFVAEYRDLTADLARLRTATRGAATPDVFYLNRLVAGAHNLLYRRRTIPLRAAAEFCFGDVPREIRRSVRPILLAAALFFVPMVVCGVAVANDAEAAAAFLPPQMFDRAEHGVRAAQTGGGYVDVPQIYRPIMASTIMTNNIQVAFFAFAGGITGGVLTLWLLLTNGVSIGAVYGLYHAKGIAALLLAFVAPHGVLELTAITIAGGAGLLMGAGLFLPGNRTRRRALVENAGRAIRLVCGAAILLVPAGLLEGFVSPIPYWPLSLKLLVSAATAVLMYLYLRLGAPGRMARTV